MRWKPDFVKWQKIWQVCQARCEHNRTITYNRVWKAENSGKNRGVIRQDFAVKCLSGSTWELLHWRSGCVFVALWREEWKRNKCFLSRSVKKLYYTASIRGAACQTVRAEQSQGKGRVSVWSKSLTTTSAGRDNTDLHKKKSTLTTDIHTKYNPNMQLQVLKKSHIMMTSFTSTLKTMLCPVVILLAE